MIVAKTLVPVVPMRVFGAFEAMPRGGAGIRLVPIRVKIGPPLTFSAADLERRPGGDARDVYQRISERVMTAIRAIEP